MTFTDPHDLPPIPVDPDPIQGVHHLALLTTERLAEVERKLDQVLAFHDELRPVLAQAAAMADQFAGQSPMQLLGSLFGR